MLSATVLLIASLSPVEAPEPPTLAPTPASASAPASAAPPPAPVTAPTARTDELVKMIAREAIAQQKQEEAERLEAAKERPDVAGVLSVAPSNDKYAVFAARVAEARTPSCLGPDGLKFNPPQIGPIAVGGLLAIPWVIGAKLNGKCN